MKVNKILKYLMILPAAVFAVSCGTTPLLEEARTSYDEAMSDSVIVSKAPVPLMQAKEQLDKIDNIRKNGGSNELVDHHAYIAKQKIAIARETARLNTTRDEVERAEAERQVVLADVQKAEAIAAQQRAEIARLEAEEAQRKANEMAQKVSELQAEKTERGLVLTLKNVIFASGKATLNPGTEANLSKLASFLLEYPERVVLIEGFTDNIGSESLNMDLSQRRAEAVKQALVEMGIESNRIRAKGYGEEYAVADNDTEVGRQLNRRVEIVISDEKGIVTERRQIQ